MKDMHPQELRDIVEQARRGDKAAFSKLYEAYFNPVYKYIYFRVSSREEADDLSQDVFLKAFASFERFEHSASSPLAYFYTIARNTVIDFYRKGSTPLASEDDIANVRDDGDSPEEASAKSEAADLLREKIKQLSDDQQHVIVLRFIDDLSTEEIAETIGKSADTVRQIQSRGLKALREIYKADEIRTGKK